MTRNNLLILLSLLFSLFIYLFYRTEKTVVNEMAIWLVSRANFRELKSYITCVLPLNKHVIYSLPEGLWVFAITITSTSLFVTIRKRKVNLILLPLFIAMWLELFQLLHITNGRFDFWDIGTALTCWAIAYSLPASKKPEQNAFAPFNSRSLICMMSYLIVYLAHVWN